MTVRSSPKKSGLTITKKDDYRMVITYLWGMLILLLQNFSFSTRYERDFRRLRRKEHIRDIAEARKPETREQRKQKLLEALLAGNGK